MDGQICGTKCLIPKVKIKVKIIVKKTGDLFSYSDKRSICSKHRDETILMVALKRLKSIKNSKTVMIKSGPLDLFTDTAAILN